MTPGSTHPTPTGATGTVERRLREADEPPKLRGCRCQCGGCGEYFSSEGAFDRHRVGNYAEPGQWKGTRRCMTLAEMLAAGFRRNPQGFLLKPPRKRGWAGVKAGTCTLTAPTLAASADATQNAGPGSAEAAW